MRAGGVALDGDCREGGTFTFNATRLKLAFPRSPTAPLNYHGTESKAND